MAHSINFVLQTTLLSSSSKLHQFAEGSQITQELGGTLSYNHNRWIDTRLVSLITNYVTLNNKYYVFYYNRQIDKKFVSKHLSNLFLELDFV